jgi:hypothetical protein
MDPDPDSDPKLDLNLTKNHPKNLQFVNYDIKNTLILHFLWKICYQIYKKSYIIVGIVTEWMFRVGSETGSETFTSRIRIRIRNYFFRIRIQNSAENGIRIRNNSYGATTLVKTTLHLLTKKGLTCGNIHLWSGCCGSRPVAGSFSPGIRSTLKYISLNKVIRSMPDTGTGLAWYPACIRIVRCTGTGTKKTAYK